MGWIHVEKKAEKSRDAATLTQCQIVATVVSHDVPSSVLHTHIHGALNPYKAVPHL